MSRLQAAVFQVLEGFTLSDDVRKILEAAYHSDDSFTQGRAAGLEECGWGVFWTENGMPCRVLYGSEADALSFAARNLIEGSGSVEPVFRHLSPTSSDAGKDDALLTIARDALEEIALAGMSGSGQESEEGMRDWHARRAWQFIGIAARAKTAIDAALSSLEVIGKGEKK